jgi:acetyl-CoA acetyltransferase
MSKVIIAGVAMTEFTKPRPEVTYSDLAAAATRDALADAGLDYSAIEQAYVGYVFGDSTAGQAALYQVGMTGIPIVNVNNNCSTGSTALYLARQAVAAGAAECVLALGFEQMVPGALGDVFADRPSPLGKFAELADELTSDRVTPRNVKLFGGAGAEYQKLYGTKPETFARVTQKARRHAANNPRAIFRTQVTVEEVLASPSVYGPLTRLQCCPPTSGAAAAIVVSERFARRFGVQNQVALRAQAMTTDFSTTFDDRSMIKLVGSELTAAAAQLVYSEAGIGPEDVDVVELHDCFTSNEIISYEGLGLTSRGTAEKFIWDGDNTYGGKVVTNPSGGLLSKGHPLGATGLAQCAEIVWQLRGQAGVRQVAGARIGLQHNLGLGGACVVGLYEKL